MGPSVWILDPGSPTAEKAQARPEIISRRFRSAAVQCYIVPSLVSTSIVTPLVELLLNLEWL